MNKSTISRELKRNLPTRGETAGKYIGAHAQRKTDYRHSNKPKLILWHTGRRQKHGNLKDNRGAITQRVSIEQRPKVVAQRKPIGDIEIDL